jgi:hypothetical protein
MELRHLEDWIDKARKITVELEKEPTILFRNESRDAHGEIMSQGYNVVDVEFSTARNQLTFVIE